MYVIPLIGLFDYYWLFRHFLTKTCNCFLQMIVLACYGLVIHLISFVVLQVKYTLLKGKLLPLEDPPPARKTTKHTKASDPTDMGSSQASTTTRPKVKIVPSAHFTTMDTEIEC